MTDAQWWQATLGWQPDLEQNRQFERLYALVLKGKPRPT